jgi:hypothetical protein
VSRRASLPGAAELFRRTDTQGIPDSGGALARPEESPRRRLAAPPRGRRGSGRQKHDAKITVYVSSEELLALEHARLALRGSHGLAVDRGRIVREAVAVLLDDFEEYGEDSVLVRRLRGWDDRDPHTSQVVQAVPDAGSVGEDAAGR